MTRPLRNAKLTLGPGRHGRVEIEGHEMRTVRSVTVHASVEDVPAVEIGLVLLDGVEVNGQMHVLLDQPTRAGLIALGWTPPEGAPRDPRPIP